MSNPIIPVVVGALIGIGGQWLYYYGVERHKLKTEREFSFEKERFFTLSSKFEELTKQAKEIMDYVLHSDNKKSSPADVLPKITHIESLMTVYFAALLDDYYTPYADAVNKSIEGETDPKTQKELKEKSMKMFAAIRDYIAEGEKKALIAPPIMKKISTDSSST